MTTTDIVKALRTDAAFFGRMPPHAKVDMNPEFMREMSQLWMAAADELERLRAERDEARKMWCHAMWLIGGKRPNEQAEAKGWDCFKQSDSVQNLTPEADIADTP